MVGGQIISGLEDEEAMSATPLNIPSTNSRSNPDHSHTGATAEIVAQVLDEERFSDLVGRPVKATRIRVKPLVSVVAGFADKETGTPQGWARFLWPISYPKARKAERKAAKFGGTAVSKPLSDGILLQTGEFITDPRLAEHLNRAFPAGLSGDILRYNPLRRIVIHRGEDVIRVSAHATQLSRSLYDFLAQRLTVSPRLDAADDPHISILRFVGDTDLSAVQDDRATYRAGRLLATLHAVSGQLPETHVKTLPVWDPAGGAAQATVHAGVLDALDPELAGRLRGITDRLPRTPAVPPVLAHGDASPDQFLLHRASGALWLTDFDRLCLAPAGFDIGSYLAAAGPESADSLLEGYRDGWRGHRRAPVPDLSTEALRPMILHSLLLRVADPLRRADPAWRESMHNRIDRIEELL